MASIRLLEIRSYSLFPFLSIILLSLFSISIIDLGFAQEIGTLEVTIDGYNSSSVLDIAIFDSKFNVIDNRTVAKPVFTIENLLLNESYSIILNYKGIEYQESISIENAREQFSMKVYEPTVSDDDIIISLYQILVESGSNYLNITEFIVFENIGDKVVNGTDLKIAIPEGFRNFIWDQDCCFRTSDFGFFFEPIEPIFPNVTKSINFKYKLEPDANEYSHTTRFYYDTENVIVMLDQELEALTTENLWSQGIYPGEREDLDVYGAASFFGGEHVSITIIGYQNTGELNILWIGVGVMAILIAGGVFYGFRSSKVSLTRLKSEEEALLSVTKQLKKDFSSKKINEVEYLKLQLKYKQQLEKVRNRIRAYNKSR